MHVTAAQLRPHPTRGYSGTVPFTWPYTSLDPSSAQEMVSLNVKPFFRMYILLSLQYILCTIFYPSRTKQGVFIILNDFRFGQSKKIILFKTFNGIRNDVYDWNIFNHNLTICCFPIHSSIDPIHYTKSSINMLFNLHIRSRVLVQNIEYFESLLIGFKQKLYCIRWKCEHFVVQLVEKKCLRIKISVNLKYKLRLLFFL